MESLLQFDRPLDVKLLESACESFQSDGNKSVEAVLVAFQRHPAAWSRVSQILEQAGALSCRLLALSILQDCVSQRWSVLPADEREGIKRYVVSTIISLSSSASPVPASLSPAQHLLFLRKLDSVLVSICKHDWPLRWPELIPELVASSRSSERLCLNNLHILCLLSEEVFSFSSASLTSDASVQMKQHLSASFQQIFALCDDLLSAPGRLSAPLLQQTLLCLHSFLHWIPVGYVFETALLQRLASCLSLPSASPSIVNAVLQCLTEVAGIRLTDEQSDKYQLTLVSTLQAALQHANATVSQLQQQADDGKRSIASLYADGSDAQQDYFRYLALFLCAFLRTQSMAAFEASEQWRPLLLSGLQLLLQLSAVDDQTVFKLCLEYWNVLVAQLYDTTRTQQAQQQRERAAAAHANNPLLAIAAQSAASSGAFASSSLLPPAAAVLRARAARAAAGDHQQDGQAGGGADRGGRQRADRARGAQGQRRRAAVQEHAGGAHLPHAPLARGHARDDAGEAGAAGERQRVELGQPQPHLLGHRQHQRRAAGERGEDLPGARHQGPAALH